jgi:hypothetical protein
MKMVNNSLDWRDVPQELYPKWAAIFYESQEGVNLSSLCPVCSEKSLHCYYLCTYPEKKIIDNRKYIGRGDLWQWCSSCRCYVHASAAIPEWWSCSLQVDLTKLMHSPEPIEQAIANSKKGTE